MLHLPPDLNIPQRMFFDGVLKNFIRNLAGAAAETPAATEVAATGAAWPVAGTAASPVMVKAAAASRA